MYIDRELREALEAAWRERKILNLDFRGMDRAKIADENPQLNPMVMYMGGMDEKRNRTIAVVESPLGLNYEYEYTMAEMLKAVEKLLCDNPCLDADVSFGYEVFEKIGGRMDLAGEEQLSRTVSIRNGWLVEAKQ